MKEGFYITEVKGRQILDSRGNPTVEAEVIVNKYNVKEENGKQSAESIYALSALRLLVCFHLRSHLCLCTG